MEGVLNSQLYLSIIVLSPLYLGMITFEFSIIQNLEWQLYIDKRSSISGVIKSIIY